MMISLSGDNDQKRVIRAIVRAVSDSRSVENQLFQCGCPVCDEIEDIATSNEQILGVKLGGKWKSGLVSTYLWVGRRVVNGHGTESYEMRITLQRNENAVSMEGMYELITPIRVN